MAWKEGAPAGVILSAERSTFPEDGVTPTGRSVTAFGGRSRVDVSSLRPGRLARGFMGDYPRVTGERLHNQRARPPPDGVRRAVFVVRPRRPPQRARRNCHRSTPTPSPPTPRIDAGQLTMLAGQTVLDTFAPASGRWLGESMSSAPGATKGNRPPSRAEKWAAGGAPSPSPRLSPWGAGAMAAAVFDATPRPGDALERGTRGPPILCGAGRAVVGDGRSPGTGRPRERGGPGSGLLNGRANCSRGGLPARRGL